MLLLNVSDIHFKYPRCVRGTDPDKPFRTQVIFDVRDMRESLGDVGAILVTGDIAATGIKEEYDAAYEWLMKLAAESGCRESRIYVVPGNHDVNRQDSVSDPTIASTQKTILLKPHHERERELEKHFEHPNSAQALLAPIAAYNDFAAKFSCQLWAPDQLYWTHTIPINDHTELKLHGLNSTLFSGIGGENDRKPDLYLSPLQTVLNPEDDILNAVLCHHPPDWCSDCDQIENAVKERAVLHFFGHKHLQRIDEASRYVRFSAGAINPDRTEVGWEPGYNLVKLEIVEEDPRRYLAVEAHLRIFQTSPARFIARENTDGSKVFKHRVPIPKARRSRIHIAPEVTSCTSTAAEQEKFDVEEIMSQERTLTLVQRFWKLGLSQRKEVMTLLELVTQEELALPESERYGKAWKRAGDSQKIEELAKEIEKREIS